MMDWQRSGLIASIVVVFGILFVRWNHFEETRQPVVMAESEETLVVPANVAAMDRVASQPRSGQTGVPELSDPTTDPDLGSAMSTDGDRLVSVVTDVLEVTIDTLGGDLVRAALPKHLLSSGESGKPFVLLTRTTHQTYIAQSGLIGPNGTDTRDKRPLFGVAKHQFLLPRDEETLSVELNLEQNGVSITKTYVFRRGDYLIDVIYSIKNGTDTDWQANLFGQIQRDTYDPETHNAMAPRPYLGMALTTVEDNYKKITFDDLTEGPFKSDKQGGWVAMVQHYFVSAWVPDQQQQNQFQLRKLGQRDVYAAGFTGPSTVIAAGETGQIEASFYVGPKDQQRLEGISPYLDLTIDYGWLWWVAKPLFAGLNLINTFLGNWGWSILILTVFVKLLFFPLSAASYRSMARMRKLQPEMLRLRELYGDDRQKLSQEMMGLYKKEKVNPLGGCLPMLIQMPVFIALYWVLNESVELRHAPWILWITDLSVKDPYYVLPVLNGISMFVLQTLQPAPPDPTQAKVMKIMPIAFSFFFMFFPAGLVLYWTANSVLSIAQQWAITRKIEAE